MATTKPIKILVIGMEVPPALLALAEQGHTVKQDGEPFSEYGLYEPDVVVGPKCWRWLPDVSGKWVNLLVKEARAAQPPRAKKAKVKKGASL